MSRPLSWWPDWIEISFPNLVLLSSKASAASLRVFIFHFSRNLLYMWLVLVIARVGKSNQVWLDALLWLTAVIFLILSYFTLPYFPRKNISYHSRTKEAKCKIRKGNIQCQTLPPPSPPFSQAFLATPLLTRLHYSWLPSSLDRAVMYIKRPRCCNISM